MARVNHKKINRLVYNESSTLNDRQFFTSKEFAAYLQDILDIISQAYHTKKFVRIAIDWDEEPGAKVAYTNDKTLFINAGTYLMKDLVERSERFEGVLGLMLHEDGHLLFTNFAKSTEVHLGIMNKKLLMIPSKDYEEVYEAYEKVQNCLSSIKNKQVLGIIANLWHMLENCLEDGHVDWRISERYPGYKPHLEFINDLAYDHLPSIADIKRNRNKKMQENPDEPVFLIYDFIQYLLLYSRYGYLKGEEWEIVKEEAAMKIYDMIDWIDFAKETKDSVQRILFQSIVFYLSFPFDYVDALLQKYGNEDNSTVGEEAMKNLEETLNNVQSTPSGGLKTSDVSTLASSMSSTPYSPAGDHEAENHTKANEEKENDSGMDMGASVSDTGDGKNKESSAEQDHSSVCQGDSKESIDATEEEKNNVSEKTQKSLCDSSSMTSQKEKEREKGSKNAASDMQRVLDKINKNNNLQKREKHFESELNVFAASVKHRDIHKGVGCEVRRIDVPDQCMIDGYNQIWAQISHISKKLQGRLEKQLKKKRKGYKQNNLYFGRKLEASNLVRGDGKCFSKKQLPSNKQRLAVGLLVDESGSMASSDRITHARMTSMVVYDFCNKLGIPIAVYGHSAGHYPDVILNAYAEFDSVDKNDKYRIMRMDCSGCNRDGYALRYMAERLAMQDTEIKLLFIISDGRPNARDYKGHDAYEDLASIQKEYYNKNIITIAAAIGDDKETIEHIYGKEAFLDVTDLSELPKNLITIIKNYL